jgi:hypothetical protein
MIRAVAGVAMLSVALVSSAPAPPGLVRLGEVLLFSYPDLPSNIDPKAAEPTLRALAAERSEPGIGVHLFLADRGSRKGQYAVVWVVDTLKRRQQGSSAQEPFVKNGAEYHLVAPETVGALPDVDVLGLHYTTVRPDRVEAFERFVREKLHPSVANLRPDLRILYYRSARREDAGRYVALFALTRVSRDKYWPGGSDSDELRAAFKPVQGLTKELSTYLVDGSYLADPKFAAAVFESRQWADFVLVPADPR